MEDGGGEHRDGLWGRRVYSASCCTSGTVCTIYTPLSTGIASYHLPSFRTAVSLPLLIHPIKLHFSRNASRHAVTSRISTATRGGATIRIGTRMEILFIWQPRHDADRTRLRKKKSLRKAISNPHPDHPCPGARPPSCSWTASRTFVEIVFVRESSRSPLRLVYSGRGIRGYI